MFNPGQCKRCEQQILNLYKSKLMFFGAEAPNVISHNAPNKEMSEAGGREED